MMLTEIFLQRPSHQPWCPPTPPDEKTQHTEWLTWVRVQVMNIYKEEEMNRQRQEDMGENKE